MKLKQLAALGLVAAMLVVAAAVPAHAATGPEEVTAPCLPSDHDGRWPLWTQGRPARDPGVRVWHDGTGWHVRVTHDALRDRVFSGAVRTRGAIVNVQSVRLERNDYVKVSDDKHTLLFRFHNYGGIDGFDFNTRCAPALQFGFLSNGVKVPTAKIAVGAAARHPATNPFVIWRTDAPE
jgi:hypothetical protein